MSIKPVFREFISVSAATCDEISSIDPIEQNMHYIETALQIKEFIEKTLEVHLPDDPFSLFARMDRTRYRASSYNKSDTGFLLQESRPKNYFSTVERRGILQKIISPCGSFDICEISDIKESQWQTITDRLGLQLCQQDATTRFWNIMQWNDSTLEKTSTYINSEPDNRVFFTAWDQIFTQQAFYDYGVQQVQKIQQTPASTLDKLAWHITNITTTRLGSHYFPSDYLPQELQKQIKRSLAYLFSDARFFIHNGGSLDSSYPLVDYKPTGILAKAISSILASNPRLKDFYPGVKILEGTDGKYDINIRVDTEHSFSNSRLTYSILEIGGSRGIIKTHSFTDDDV